MPTWTISAPKEFQKTVKENAPKLGEGYSEFIQKAVYERVKRLSGKDFEKAKKRVELIEKKKKLSTIRETERVLLREKGYKKKNIARILKDVNDKDVKAEFLKVVDARGRLAEEVIELDKEVNPIGEEKIEKPKFKSKKEKLAWYRQKVREQKELELSRKKEELPEVHAHWDDFEDGFLCDIKGDRLYHGHKICNLVYESVEIIEHLRDEHGIEPDEQVIEGWGQMHEKKWRKRRKLKGD